VNNATNDRARPLHSSWRLRACLTIAVVLAAVPTREAMAANAAPLGVEIGVSTYDQVKRGIGKSTPLEDRGVNRYSGGKMLAGDGSGLAVDGLKELTFIFDREGMLQAVLLTLDKNFRPTYEMLRRKYKLVSQRIPFVGDSFARFSQGQSVILLEAPHLSFEMTLSYVSQTFLSAYQERSSADKARREKEQSDRL